MNKKWTDIHALSVACQCVRDALVQHLRDKKPPEHYQIVETATMFLNEISLPQAMNMPKRIDAMILAIVDSIPIE